MNPDDHDRQETEDPEPEHSYEETARSIFSALWFRVVLVLIVLGVIAAVAVPYVLEWMNPPPPKTAAVKSAPPAAKPPAPPATPPVAAPAPAPAPTVPPAAPKPAVTPAPAPAPVVAKEEKEEKAATPARRPAKAATAKAPAKAAAKAPAAAGAYFVQVGAFKDPELAKRLAAKLREQKFSVEESTLGPAGDGAGKPAAAAPAPAPISTAGDKYDVFVSGAAAADIGAKLTAKGLATERSGGGVVVRPSLPLRDAVALSKDLAADGLKVQVRRAGFGAPAPAAATPAAAGSGETVHRVRVGPFAALAAARVARAALEEKGYKGFIARGGE